MVYYINSGEKNALGRCGLQRQKGICSRLKSASTGNRMGTSGSPVGSALGKRAYREWDENVGLARGQEWDGKFGLARGAVNGQRRYESG